MSFEKRILAGIETGPIRVDATRRRIAAFQQRWSGTTTFLGVTQSAEDWRVGVLLYRRGDPQTR